ncbi:hypothetical protein RLIN73S_02481 [Rhodanobacter lindaniclasticus]
MTDADLQAVATYLQSLPPRAPTAAAPFRQAASHEQGGKLYAQRCADCHGDHGQGVAGVYPPLDGNTSVTGPTSVNAVRSVLLGGFAPATAANPRPYSMPPFAQQLDDAEVAAVVGYIRQSWSNKAGAVTPGEVGRYRHTPVDSFVEAAGCRMTRQPAETGLALPHAQQQVASGCRQGAAATRLPVWHATCSRP